MLKEKENTNKYMWGAGTLVMISQIEYEDL